MQHGKSITIFLVDGSTDGIITGELSNWNGKIIKLPRESVSSAKRPELKGPGIYFLFCTDTENGEDACYIGESECMQDRLNQHLLDFKSGKEKYYWQTVVAICGNDLNKALIRYLENRTVEIARNSKRYRILTKNTSKEVVLKEHEKASMEEFIDNSRTLLSALNYRILEPLVRKPIITGKNKLYLQTKKASGTGYLTADNKFLLEAGSVLSEETASRCPAAALKARKQLIEEGLVTDWKTKEDTLFSSSSKAAAFLTGFSISGPEYWKDKKGVPLKTYLKSLPIESKKDET